MSNIQNRIAALMEDLPMPGNTSVMTGGNTAQMAMTVLPDGPDDTSVSYAEQKPEGFNEQELRMAKHFVELMGSADRARDAISKVDECLDCLGLVDDECDQSTIDNLADAVPSSPDMPTNVRKALDLSTLYNDAAGSGFMS